MSKSQGQDSSSQTEHVSKIEKATDPESEMNQEQLVAVNKSLVTKINHLQNELDELKVNQTYYEFPRDVSKQYDIKRQKNSDMSEVELANICPIMQQSAEQMAIKSDNLNSNVGISGRYDASSKEVISSLQPEPSIIDLTQSEERVPNNKLQKQLSDSNESRAVKSFTENQACTEIPFGEKQESSTTKSDFQNISHESPEPRPANRLREFTKSFPTPVKNKEREINENHRIRPTLKNKITKYVASIKNGGSQRKTSNDKSRATLGRPQIKSNQKLIRTVESDKNSKKTKTPHVLPATSASQDRRLSNGKVGVASHTNDTQYPSTSKGTYTSVESEYPNLKDEKSEDKMDDKIEEKIVNNNDVPNKAVQNNSILSNNGEAEIKQSEEVKDTYTIDETRDSNKIINDVTSDSSEKTGRDVQSLPEESYDNCDICKDGKCLTDMIKCENITCQTIHNPRLSAADDVTNNEILYSDGEVPADLFKLRKKEEALKAEKQRLDDISTQTRNKEDSTSVRVEEALKAISVELLKCRALLEAASPKRKSMTLEESNQPNMGSQENFLKASKALPTISNTFTPIANFNINIGKIVFSDAALMKSEEIKLFLHWKFYHQPPTLIPVKMQRVVDFNFVVEYKVMLTKDFIKYLTNDTFVIALCEIWKTDIPFAKCKVPLRKFVKNPGKRVDFFLGMFDEQSSDSVKRLEVGVIDFRCSFSFHEKYRKHFNALVTKEHTQDYFPLKLSRAEQLRTASAMVLNTQDKASLQEANAKFEDPLRQNSVTDMSARKSVLTMSMLSSVNEASISKNSDTAKVFKDDIRRLTNEAQGSYRDKDDSWFDVIENDNWNRMVFQKPSAVDKHDDPNIERKEVNEHNTETARVLGNRKVIASSQKSSDGATSEATSTNSGFIATNEDATSLSPFLPQDSTPNEQTIDPTMDKLIVTVRWLAFNNDSDVMHNSKIIKIYVAYTFLDFFGADLETPSSLPKPMNATKMYFNFQRSFPLNEKRKQMLANMSRQFSTDKNAPPGSCIVFSIISEPVNESGSQENCEDIGRASLCFGDILLYCHGDHYMEVIPVEDIINNEVIIGVLAVKIDGVDVLRQINRNEEINIK